MRAAMDIFARDGFEAARLEDIAREAGYTRGAFYANFASKDDLFVALFQEEMARRSGLLRTRIAGLAMIDDKLHAIRDFYVELSRDHRWSLLALEFKLFAIRHPEMRARLASLHSEQMTSPLVRELLDEVETRMPVSRVASRLSLVAMAQALTLEHLLDADAMTEQEVARLLEIYFDAVTGRTQAAQERRGEEH